MFRRRILLLCFCMFTHVFTYASEKEVVWVTPEWDSYTNVDGTGLYNEIIRDIFSLSDIRVRQVYKSWKRSLLMVENLQADITGGTEKSPTYYHSRYPILSDYEYVMYHHSAISNWNGLKSLEGLTGVWVEGYLSGTPDEVKQHLSGFGVRSRETALQMLVDNMRGVDFYLDNNYQMKITQAKFQSQEAFHGYVTKELYHADIFMAFQKTDRGKKLRDQFDWGFEQLYCNGHLHKAYKKYQLKAPQIKFDCSRASNKKAAK